MISRKERLNKAIPAVSLEDLAPQDQTIWVFQIDDYKTFLYYLPMFPMFA